LASNTIDVLSADAVAIRDPDRLKAMSNTSSVCPLETTQKCEIC
jgi:hypothetical protein